MATLLHQNNFATNLTSGTSATDTTSPLDSIPTIAAPFYIAFDATNVNGHYEVLLCTSKTVTNVNHAALSYDHTITEEVRMVIPAAEMDNLATISTQTSGVWLAWVPSFYKSDQTTALTGTTDLARYTQVGKMVFGALRASALGDPSGINIGFSLPIAAKSEAVTRNIGSGLGNYGSWTSCVSQIEVAVTTKSTVYLTGLPNWGAAGNNVSISFCYEAA